MKAWQVSLGLCCCLQKCYRWLLLQEKNEGNVTNAVLLQTARPARFSALVVLMFPSLLIEWRFSQQNVSVNLYLHHCCGCGSCIPHKIALMVKLNFQPAIRLQATGVLRCLQEQFRGCSVDSSVSADKGQLNAGNGEHKLQTF